MESGLLITRLGLTRDWVLGSDQVDGLSWEVGICKNRAGQVWTYLQPMVVEPRRTHNHHQRRGLVRHMLTTGIDPLPKEGAEAHLDLL